ncbi:unnamed protein product [Didymodactylos carnosus]|uniref:Uncharacterized protein n=1 Tax=Didymodactylos carnosus TaxID=1234261 RepID=A0A813PNK6_9BILA|nr:unnamed protein product [Didymodactylos carnosus]CAF0808277.1 unnamed protein product [Didymodactylos carnosus]CAF3536351.1 unnamed protein product [Didymodactylos carnosus]CAF3592028.1 unnamed protein product [Didymodactylos carnosus]
MAAKVLKATTNLTGLAVSKDPHYSLKLLYGKILRDLKKIPDNSAYRKYTEELTQSRLQHVLSEPDIAKLERKINCGQIEEVIIQAENELTCARRMTEHKVWEPLTAQAPANQWKWPI